MSLIAPPRPPATGNAVDHEELEALIEEARRRAQRRRRMYIAGAAFVALAVVALSAVLEHGFGSQTASPRLPARSGVPGAAADLAIVFLRFPNGPGWGGLYLVNADGSGERVLARNGRGYDWSPDRRQLAFEAGRFEAIDGNVDIFVMNADGSGRRRLTRGPAREAAPHWSSDGRTISFVRWSRSGGTFAIYEMNADGRRQRRLTGELDAENAFKPFVWSPDGRRVAFQRLRDGNSDVWVMNSDGTGLRNLTQSPQSEYPGEWSPDGRKLIVHGSHVFIVNADGSGLRRLRVVGPSGAAWSPDGHKLAIAGGRDLGHVIEVYVVNADGSGLRRLARHEGKTDPWVAWSPDGSELAFTSGRDGSSDIWVMNPDGGGLRRLTRSPEWDANPVWVPALGGSAQP
jgi:Tol biopolymer transport system component